MKRKIAAILVCILLAICSAFNVVASMSVEKPGLFTQSNSNKGSTTLIADVNNNSVIEVDNAGMVVWQKTGLVNPVDAERLANGNTLIAEVGGNRVIEVDSGGNIVWNYSGQIGPFDAERLANGNTLITDLYGGRVIEVDTGGNIIWNYSALNGSVDAERLENGNTLISEVYNNRVIEVDSGGTIVWQKTGVVWPIDVERLENGNTLITEYMNVNRVIEVDSGGNIVWEYNSSNLTFDAERFANGNTLITEFSYLGGRVIEVDSGGTIVWQKTGLITPSDAERISNPPTAPTINGQTSGNTGTSYPYLFNSTDPDGDDVRYFIDWGDNTSEWTGYNPSGTDVTVNHNWNNDGTYNITAKAQDIYGLESPEGKLTVTMPKNRALNYKFNLLERFFGRFPNLFPILRYLLG